MSTEIKEKFVVPSIIPGDVVFWWQHGITNNTPLPAMVVLYDDRNGLATLKVFSSNEDKTFGGVRHRDDEELTLSGALRSGCWAEREETAGL